MHMHTIYSDGDLCPAELVTKARDLGLKAISVTDHDTVDGLESTERECRKMGLQFIPGIEFTTNFDPLGIEVHVLGYGFDKDDSYLQKKMEITKKRAWKYADELVDLLSSHGWLVDYARIEATKGIITKHDIALAVVNRDMSTYEFHDLWLTEKTQCFIDVEKFQIEEAIDIIHRAGGKAIGAHLIRTLDQYNSLPLLADVVDHFVNCGMDGFEVFYGKNNWQQVKSMLDLCRSYGLLMTGGSDYHGPGRTGRCPLGGYNVHNFYYDQEKLLKTLSKSAITVPESTV
jgi:predicted metal-dependent phosphoesterase TrpH